MPGHTHAVGLAYPELAEAPVLQRRRRERRRGPRRRDPGRGRAVRGHGGRVLVAEDPRRGDLRLRRGRLRRARRDDARALPPPRRRRVARHRSRRLRAVRRARERRSSPTSARRRSPGTRRAAAADIADTTIGQYWGFVTPTDGMDEKARAFVDNGAQLILSPADAIYLDMKYPSGRARSGSPGRTARRASSAPTRGSPSAVIAGIDEGDILGVEAPMWSETIRTLDDIDEHGLPARRRGRRGRLVAGDRRERPAHVGVLPRARRRARAAVDEPRHRLPPLGRDPLGRPSEHGRPLGATR